ncbi:MAG: aldo/keto reductase [Ilumatobacter sp.]|nr:aldo/keto reductase [Ilumatobacter sp.]
MRYTKLGRSGLDVSAVCLGCMGFGESSGDVHSWTVGEAESRTIIERALELGVNFFDTANVYSLGSSEEIVGKVLGDAADRDDVVIATKVYFPMRGGDAQNSRGLSRKAIMTEVDHSLRRLGTDYIDLYQIHRFDDLTPVEETMTALHELVEVGKVRYLGASSMWAWQFAKLQHAADRLGLTRFVSMQNQYSLLQREEEREMLPLCADQGVGSIPWSPLARGLLARPWETTTARREQDGLIDHRFSEAVDRPIVDRVESVAAAKGVPMAQLAMAWVMANPVVTAPIVGATRVGHVEDAVAALDVELTAEDRAAVEEPYRPKPASF